MLKEVYKNIYLNEIDLPKNPLKYLNSYIITSENRNLIIDTGFNRKECIDSFYYGISELKIDLTKTDVLVTHLHSDHNGLMGMLEQQGATIIMGNLESNAILQMGTKENLKRFENLAKMYDLEKYSVNITEHPGFRYRPEVVSNYKLVQDGQTLQYGEYEFQVMLTPGHTKGHICLYEPFHKLFFCGDLILDKITPTITFWGFEQDILQVYFDTLKKVDTLAIEHLFTGHRSILTEQHTRIKQLIAHHEKRLAEIKDILRDGEQSVCDVASKMHWDITIKSWEDFPNAQKWFATGEAMSHLEHLYCNDILQKRYNDNTIMYRLK